MAVPRPRDYLPRLGVATEYEVFLTDRSLYTDIRPLPWSKVSWSRCVDDISDAQLDIGDSLGGLGCVSDLSDLRPWRYGLRISRNGYTVWAGPITNIRRPARSEPGGEMTYTFDAVDKFGWTKRRPVSEDHDFTNEDVGASFQWVIENAVSFDNEFLLLCPDFTTGITYQRQYKALDFEYAYDVLSELAKAAVDYTVIGHDLWVWDTSGGGWKAETIDGTRWFPRAQSPGGIPSLGTLTERHFLEQPGWMLDGWRQSNQIYVLGADSGEQGFRHFWEASEVDLDDGLLTEIVNTSNYRPAPNDPLLYDAAFQRQADSTLAARKRTPLVWEGGSWSPHFPVAVQDLIPGAWATMDFTENGESVPGISTSRLKRIDCEATAGRDGLEEKMSGTFIPLGTEEDS